jgi:hypothetical protein
VKDTFYEGPAAGVNSNNSDLWKEVFDFIVAKDLSVSVRWMPSHTKDNQKKWCEGVSAIDVEANDMADKYAGEAAQKYELPNPVTCGPIYYYKLIKKIQKRLATIIMNLPDRTIDRKEKLEKIPKETISHLLLSTQHTICTDGTRVSCSVCLNNYKVSDGACRDWLRSPCVAIKSPHFGHTKIDDTASIHIGNNTIHVSHNLFKYRGLIYCLKCGALGTTQVRYLARPCQPPTVTGARNLQCLLAGKKPASISAWPE